MPEVSSIGLGGGSLVDMTAVKIGPDSVAYRLTTEALVMGGNTLTMSDIAVAAGLFDLGDRSRVAHIEPRSVEAVLGAARRMLAYNIDRVKGSAEPVPLIAVGGASVLIPDGLEGVETVIRVEHGECANAVGAAIAQVSGEVDRVFQGVDRKEALAEAIRLANLNAVDSGADADSLQTIESEDIPIAYLPGNALRVRVRVVGDIAAGSETVPKSQEDLQCQFAS
jgi:N-methylhydantoinase A/oxoprolinase/acetone carboxylase beta subunit